MPLAGRPLSNADFVAFDLETTGLYCHIDGIEKTYRLDRIREMRIEEL